MRRSMTDLVKDNGLRDGVVAAKQMALSEPQILTTPPYV